MEHLTLHDSVQWPNDDTCACVLCDHADDIGSAMGYLKQMDTACGGRVTDANLAQMMLESYNTFFYEPAVAAGQNPPTLTEEAITTHFTQHDINPLRQMRNDLRKINLIQDCLNPRQSDNGGAANCNKTDAKDWLAYQRLKMDLMQQYRICDKQTPRDMPSLSTS